VAFIRAEIIYLPVDSHLAFSLHVFPCCGSLLLVIYWRWLIVTGVEKKEFSPAASNITFHVHAVDKATAEEVREKLREKAKDLIQMVEIKDSNIKRLGKHLVSKIMSLGTAGVAVEIGKNIVCCKQVFCGSFSENWALKLLI